MIPQTTITTGPKLFSFGSKQRWVNTAQWQWKQLGLRAEDTLCIDQKGRVCLRGADFSRAERDEAYPIDVFLTDPDHPKAMELSS